MMILAGKMGPDFRDFKTVLVVDLDSRVARATARILRTMGWEARVADSLAREDNPGIDCVITSWAGVGPKILELFSGIPILVQTGDPDRARQDIKNLGRTDIPVLTKPASVDAIHFQLVEFQNESESEL